MASVLLVPQETYDRAYKRAITEGYQIFGWAQDANGNRSWMVSTAERWHAGEYYTVRLTAAGFALSCNCDAYTHGLYCKHRALVHYALAHERATATAIEPLSADDLAEIIERDGTHERRSLLNDTKPFSLLK